MYLCMAFILYFISVLILVRFFANLLGYCESGVFVISHTLIAVALFTLCVNMWGEDPLFFFILGSTFIILIGDKIDRDFNQTNNQATD